MIYSMDLISSYLIRIHTLRNHQHWSVVPDRKGNFNVGKTLGTDTYLSSSLIAGI